MVVQIGRKENKADMMRWGLFLMYIDCNTFNREDLFWLV